MNVLSLFDGMSCGRIALDRLGISVDNYFASEIDASAIKVSRDNWPEINHLGDVRNVLSGNLPKIDLLIGGSPCQGFSYAGKGLNFDDPRSKLFFEFVRLKKELNPTFFFLENVKMKKESEDIITEYLGVPPITVNSKSVSVQSRVRLYWTNIPHKFDFSSDGPLLSSILGPIPDLPKYLTIRDKANTIRVDGGGSPLGSKQIWDSPFRIIDRSAFESDRPIPKNIEKRRYTVAELERIQTVPEGYTKSVSDTQARKMLGNGWTVDVIVEFFKGMI